MRRDLASVLLAVVVVVGVAHGQSTDRGEERTYELNLGPTGARGRMTAARLSTRDAREITVIGVAEGSPADGALRVGDVIVGVEGKAFDGDARVLFGRAVTAAEAAEDGALRVLVRRDGRESAATLTLKRLGAYAETSPFGCEKSARVLDAACAYLAKKGLGDGVQGHVNALALLAAGRAEDEEIVRAYARKIGPKNLKLSEDEGLPAWNWGYAATFLGEYVLATGDAEVVPALKEYARTLARGQSPVGTWGHGMVESEEGLPRLGGYGAVNQAGLGCWLGLLLAEKCRIREPEIVDAIERSRTFFRFFVGKGAIPYGDHPPLWDLHDNNGKNAQAAVAFDLLDDGEAVRFFARTAVAGYAERELGHTGNYFGILWGTLGAARGGDAAAAAHQRELRWFWDLSRSADGGFDYQGAPGEADSYAGWDATGAYVLSYVLPRGRTYLGGKGRTAATLSDADVADAVAAGRDCDVRDPKRSYVGRTDAELLRGLESWSPTVRHRSAAALAAQDDAAKHLPALTKLLTAERIEGRYGAAQALELMGRRAAPATDALVAQLNETDVWLRIRAAYALAGIGAPARGAAAEPLLRLAAADDDDPRATLRRYLALALFLDGHLDNGPPRGLLGASAEGVERPLLTAAVRRMLRLDDGLARSHAANALPLFDVEEREGLWRDLLDAVIEVAPSGEMFAHGVRLAALKLLARHRVFEGMSAAVIYARSQTSWGSEDRMGEILANLDAYGAAAKEWLPALRKIEKRCREEKDFPEDCRKKKTAAVAAAIRRIEAATATPPLRYVALAQRGMVQRGAAGRVKVFVLAGQSNMEGQAVVDLDGPDYNGGRGTYRSLLSDSPDYGPYAGWSDGKGGWRTRDDVRVWYRPEGGPVKSGPLGIGFTPYEGKHHFGPELEIGRVLGDAFAEPVLLVKTAWGGKSLRVDFRPPSAGGTVGPYYLKMLEDVRAATAEIGALFPEIDKPEFEIAGFVWFHGWNDMCDPEAVPEYEANLGRLIADVRRAWDRPDLPVVIGELGNGGSDASPEMRAIRAAQRAVAARKDLRDTVLFVGTQSFQRKPEDSPNPGHLHHEFGNAETYLLTGVALGEGMRLLLGGALPK